KYISIGTIIINIILNLLFFTRTTIDVTILLFSFPIGIVGIIASCYLEKKHMRVVFVLVNFLLAISFLYPFLLWKLASKP
ncbi:TPA: hypothetical protein ACIZEL_003036, partial [Enterococcus faecium]